MKADLPPEAYTRDTLQAAFDWLQTQPDIVRASVHTPERLVSLFRRAQRLNDNDHPVSSKKFVTDLKNLAMSLDQFSGSPATLETPLGLPDPPMLETPVVPPTPRPTPPPKEDPVRPSTQTSSEETVTETAQKASFEVKTNTRQKSTTVSKLLDPTTESRIQEVQMRFNLGSREETLRLLISLGYEKFSQIP